MKPTDALVALWPMLVAVLVGNAPIFGLVVYFMRKGPDEKITAIRQQIETKVADMERDVRGIGGKLDQLSRERAGDFTAITNLQLEQGKSADDRTRIRERLSKNEANVQSLSEQISSGQRDVMELIRSSSTAQLTAVHEAEKKHALALADARVEIAKLGERANIVESLAEIGDRLERSIKLAIERDIDRRR